MAAKYPERNFLFFACAEQEIFCKSRGIFLQIREVRAEKFSKCARKIFRNFQNDQKCRFREIVGYFTSDLSRCPAQNRERNFVFFHFLRALFHMQNRMSKFAILECANFVFFIFAEEEFPARSANYVRRRTVCPSRCPSGNRFCKNKKNTHFCTCAEQEICRCVAEKYCKMAFAKIIKKKRCSKSARCIF